MIARLILFLKFLISIVLYELIVSRVSISRALVKFKIALSSSLSLGLSLSLLSFPPSLYSSLSLLLDKLKGQFQGKTGPTKLVHIVMTIARDPTMQPVIIYIGKY